MIELYMQRQLRCFTQMKAWAGNLTEEIEIQKRPERLTSHSSLTIKFPFMATHLFEETNIHSAYNALHRFFEVYGISDAVQYIESGLLAATTHKVWKRKAPGELLFFTENLEALCQVVFTINSGYAEPLEEKTDVLEDSIPDISATNHLLDSQYHSNAWNNFPRSLTAAQYHDPCKAIAKFCNYMPAGEWEKFIREMLEYALSNESIYEGSAGYDILKIRLRLLQMVEAAHLIDVRVLKTQTSLTEDNQETENN